MLTNIETFRDRASRYRVVPVTLEVLADRETPVSAFEKLVGDGDGFLFESVQGGEQWAQWSFLGWDPAFTLQADQGKAHIIPGFLDPQLPEGDPLQVLEAVTRWYTSPDDPELPPLHSGLVGYSGYDMIRYVERLPNRPPDDRGLPEMSWMVPGFVAAFDRFKQTITLVRNVFIVTADPDDLAHQYAEAVEALQSAADQLATPLSYETQSAAMPSRPVGPFDSTMDHESFTAGVEAARAHILAGDAFQIVLSQRIETTFTGEAFDIYRTLRVINPSPYLFFVRAPGVTIAGSSPELMTRVREGKVHSRPIAGTRPRGRTPEEDASFAKELLADEKERAEHVMLIDLARNDLGRVCEFGTVHIDDLMVIERYSHVMHIVSGVSGTLKPGMSAVDVLRAVFPHGTVSGAPKVRAMEIIDELEPVARGPYAGAVGYIDFSGNVDTAICLRTVVVANGKAWVQAGAGLVADSDSESEFVESMDKAAAALSAVEAANRA